MHHLTNKGIKKIGTMQKNLGNLNESHLRDFYSGLSKQEKSDFLDALSDRFGYNRITMSAKLRENAPNKLRSRELVNILKIVEEDVWHR